MLFFVWPDHKFLRSKKYISNDSYQLCGRQSYIRAWPPSRPNATALGPFSFFVIADLIPEVELSIGLSATLP
jgi:hypothetical protein